MPINVKSTSSFLTALTKAATLEVVSRAQAGTIAESLGLPFPRWYVNGAHFSLGPGQRGYFRVPTLSECESLGVGYRDASGRGRKPKVKGSSTSAVKASKPRKPRASSDASTVPTPVPVTPPTVAMTTLVQDDRANTSLQSAISKALGVDVLLGSSESTPYVPKVNKSFVPWGHFTDLKTMIGSSHFLPVMVVGPSGNGKTEMCEQVCAALGREYVRVNITSQTDEDDLIGGFRLINGETKYALGPIPVAMLRGAVVNLDEIDLGGSSLMCLQPVLEGKPLYLKKIGRYVAPAPGFTVVATANTKGRGDDGKYAHTTIMNEAMLERFAVMMEQGWAEPAVERKIIAHHLKKFDKYDASLVKHLVDWANVTRSNFQQQICNDQIATRRLLHIVHVFCALGSIDSAIAHTLSRFDTDTASAFKNLWNAFHEPPVVSPSGEPAKEAEQVIPDGPNAGTWTAKA